MKYTPAQLKVMAVKVLMAIGRDDKRGNQVVMSVSIRFRCKPESTLQVIRELAK